MSSASPYILISIGCNSLSKIKYWHEIFMHKFTAKRTFIRLNAIVTKPQKAEKSQTPRLENDTLSIENEYYKVKKDKRREKKALNSDQIEIKLNMNRSNSSSCARKIYRTTITSDNNEVEIKVTTLDPFCNSYPNKKRNSSPYGHMSPILGSFEGSKNKLRLAKKFESLKKLSQKTKAYAKNNESLEK